MFRARLNRWILATCLGSNQVQLRGWKKSGFDPYATPPKRLRIFETTVRDQEVGGSNPLAPTTKTLPFIGLSYFCIFNIARVLWTNVDQLKTQADALSPLLSELHIILEL